jgi:hypothetical protein
MRTRCEDCGTQRDGPAGELLRTIGARCECGGRFRRTAHARPAHRAVTSAPDQTVGRASDYVEPRGNGQLDELETTRSEEKLARVLY